MSETPTDKETRQKQPSGIYQTTVKKSTFCFPKTTPIVIPPKLATVESPKRLPDRQQARLQKSLNESPYPILLAVHAALNTNRQLPTSSENSAPLPIISFSGLRGSGKSLISAIVAIKTGAPLLNLDPFSGFNSLIYTKQLKEQGKNQQTDVEELIAGIQAIRKKGVAQKTKEPDLPSTLTNLLPKASKAAQQGLPFIIADLPGNYPPDLDFRPEDLYDVLGHGATEAIVSLIHHPNIPTKLRCLSRYSPQSYTTPANFSLPIKQEEPIQPKEAKAINQLILALPSFANKLKEPSLQFREKLLKQLT